jgi:hypothetical protein
MTLGLGGVRKGREQRDNGQVPDLGPSPELCEDVADVVLTFVDPPKKSGKQRAPESAETGARMSVLTFVDP